MKNFASIFTASLICFVFIFSSCESTKNLSGQEQSTLPQISQETEIAKEEPVTQPEQVFDFENAESVSEPEAGWTEELNKNSLSNSTNSNSTNSTNTNSTSKEEIIVVEKDIDHSKIKQDVKDALSELGADVNNINGTNNLANSTQNNSNATNGPNQTSATATNKNSTSTTTPQKVNSQAQSVTSQYENQKLPNGYNTADPLAQNNKPTATTIDSSTVDSTNGASNSSTEQKDSESTSKPENIAGPTEAEDNNSEIANLIDAKERTESAITTEKSDTIIEGQEIEPGNTTAKSSIVAKDIVNPSRSMEMLLNQYIDIDYPGNGWVYLGETEEVNLVKYFGRKMGKNQNNERTTTFQLRSFKPGKTILHFYKNDLLNDTYIDDYIQITVTDVACKDNSHAKAPDYSEAVPKKVELYQNTEIQNSTVIAENEKPVAPKVQETTKRNVRPTENIPGYVPSFSSSNSSAPITVEGMEDEIEVSVVNPSTDSPNLSESLLDKAQECYDNFEFERALDFVQNFLDHSLTDLDQGYYLKGKILEAKSPVQNIRESLNSYDTVVKNYPQSKVWESSNEKVIYIKRFYFNYR